MDWFEQPLDIDSPSAAVIAAGMRAVAQADGMVHQREMNLIAAFEAGLPEKEGDPNAKLIGLEIREAYLKTLIMVALADGVITSEEEMKIRELASHQGFDNLEVQTATLEVKRRFLQTFAGVHIFKDSVLRVAKDLGLPSQEVDALRGEA